MTTLSLTDATTGATIDASTTNNNNSALKTLINGSIDNTNLAAAAAISPSKLASYPADATKTLLGDGTWAQAKAVGSFSAYPSANQTGIAAGGAVKVTLDTEEWDVSGWFASSRFTPLVAGYYRFDLTACWGPTAMVSGKRLLTYLYKNGASYKYNSLYTAAASSNDTQASLSCVAVANGSTDYFEMYVRQDDTAPRDIALGGGNTFFQGELIGAS